MARNFLQWVRGFIGHRDRREAEPPTFDETVALAMRAIVLR
jgi:hypothetical protein